MQEIWFTGFDSAWGGRNPGALCDLRGKLSNDRISLELDDWPRSVSWGDAIANVNEYECRTNHVIAIDQGLIVPNENGMRPVERNLARALMGRYGCGAHASNRDNFRCYGPQAGIWRYQAALVAHGYRHCPLEISNHPFGRFYFECYPHPALLGLFNLPRILRYKVQHGDSDAWNECVRHVRSLVHHEDLPINNICELLPECLAQSKPNEDAIDAILAAYTAAYWWWFGTNRSILIGNLQTGYMITPCTDEMAGLFKTTFELDINREGCCEQSPSKYVEGEAVIAPKGRIVLPRSSITIDGGNDLGWKEAVLTAVDSGNLWCKYNKWMEKNHCEGWKLLIRILDEEDQPILHFVPFDQMGAQQGGMKPEDADTRELWRFLANGATARTCQEHQVQFTYVPLQTN